MKKQGTGLGGQTGGGAARESGMSDYSRVWVGSKGEIQEVRLCRQSGEQTVLTLRQLNGPIWHVQVDPGVSLIGRSSGSWRCGCR